MAASPRLSAHFYEHECNHPAPPRAEDAPPRPLPLSAAPRRRGFPAGTPRNRLSPQQRRTIIDMLKVTPNAAAVAREFVEAKHRRHPRDGLQDQARGNPARRIKAEGALATMTRRMSPATLQRARQQAAAAPVSYTAHTVTRRGERLEIGTARSDGRGVIEVELDRRPADPADFTGFIYLSPT
jgi:hypothetical protein